MCGEIKRLVNKLQKLDPEDPFRAKMTQLLLEKLFNMGLTTKTTNMGVADKITASAFCR
jgi:U3 small nucleolar ribonucleoprotein protein IMP3